MDSNEHEGGHDGGHEGGREEMREKLAAALRARREARKRGGGGGVGVGAGARAGAGAGTDIDVKAHVSKMVKALLQQVDEGTFVAPPDFADAALTGDDACGVSLEKLQQVCARRGMDPRFASIIASALQRAQEGTASLEEITTAATEECIAVSRAVARRSKG